MKNVTNGFSRMAEPVFNQLLSFVIDSITNNAAFPGLQDEIAALKEKADAFKMLFVKAANGGKDAIYARNTARAEIVQILYTMGLQVSAIAKGDEQILSSSGFPYTRTRQPTTLLTTPPPPTVTTGINNGQLICKTNKQKGTKAIGYLITSTPHDVDSWQKTYRTKTNYTFSNLTGGTRYYIKIGMLGIRGQEVFSEHVCYIPQ